MKHSFLQKLDTYWFEPMPSSRLAILRIATGGLSLWYLLTRFDMLASLSENGLSMYAPVGIMKFFSAPFSDSSFHVILLATIAFNIFYIFGWKFRYTGPAFGVLLLLLFCYRNSYSMIYHNYNLLVLHVFIIGIAASADALSIDSWLGGAKNKRAFAHNPYGWPIKLICVATVLGYFVSGMAKITGELAWEWISGEAMRSQVAVDAIRKNALGEESSTLFYSLYPHTWIFLITGLLTMVVELGAPLFLIKKRLVYVWVLLAFSMHWGIYFIMHITFFHHMLGIVFLPFLQPEKWWDYVRNKAQTLWTPAVEVTENKESSVVLFDGICNFCDSTVRFIIDRDPKGHFHFAPLQSEKGKILLQAHHLPNDLSGIVLVQNNKAYTQSTAMLHILRELKGGWSLLYVFILVPPFIRNAVYRIIAGNRYRWFGQKESCTLPTTEIRQRFYV